MKSRVGLLFLLGMTGIAPVVAQEQVPDDEAAKRAEINEIKLSENAIYADVVEIATDDNEAVSLAQQKSINMLQAHVIEVFAKRLHMEPKDVQEIWDVIDDKCQNIVVRKGDLFRVFSYIVKDAIGLGRKKPKEGDVEKYLLAKEEEEKEQKIVINLTSMLTGGQDSINNVVQPQPADTLLAAKEPVQAAPIPLAPVPADPVIKDTPIAEAPQPSVKETPAPVAVVTPESEKAPVPEPAAIEQPAVIEQPAAAQPAVPELVQTMFDKQDMVTLLKYLSAEKDAQRLMFGNARTMTSPEKCYVVIVDKRSRKILTILGTGSTERTNYRTFKPDNLEKFKQGMYSAIFVQLY